MKDIKMQHNKSVLNRAAVPKRRVGKGSARGGPILSDKAVFTATEQV